MLKQIRQGSIGFLIVFSALSVIGCSSGSGSSGSESSAQSSELDPGLFYIGRILDGGSKSEGDSLISPTGEFVVTFSNQSKTKVSYTFGSLQFSDAGKISGPIEEYVSGPPWTRTTGTLSGNVTSSEMANLSATRPGVSSNAVLLRDHDSSNAGVTFRQLSGNYTVPDPNITAWITIGPEGEVTGGNQDCVLNGDVTIPDPTVDIFEISYEAANCSSVPDEGASETDRNGNFSGLGAYKHSDGEMYFFSHNGTVPWMFIGKK